MSLRRLRLRIAEHGLCRASAADALRLSVLDPAGAIRMNQLAVLDAPRVPHEEHVREARELGEQAEERDETREATRASALVSPSYEGLTLRCRQTPARESVRQSHDPSRWWAHSATRLLAHATSRASSAAGWDDLLARCDQQSMGLERLEVLEARALAAARQGSHCITAMERNTDMDPAIACLPDRERLAHCDDARDRARSFDRIQLGVVGQRPHEQHRASSAQRNTTSCGLHVIDSADACDQRRVDARLRID